MPPSIRLFASGIASDKTAKWIVEVYRIGSGGDHIAALEFRTLPSLRNALTEHSGNKFFVTMPIDVNQDNRNTLLDLRAQGFDIAIRMASVRQGLIWHSRRHFLWPAEYYLTIADGARRLAIKQAVNDETCNSGPNRPFHFDNAAGFRVSRWFLRSGLPHLTVGSLRSRRLGTGSSCPKRVSGDFAACTTLRRPTSVESAEQVLHRAVGITAVEFSRRTYA
jgi:hypothetical protein